MINEYIDRLSWKSSQEITSKFIPDCAVYFVVEIGDN